MYVLPTRIAVHPTAEEHVNRVSHHPLAHRHNGPKRLMIFHVEKIPIVTLRLIQRLKVYYPSIGGTKVDVLSAYVVKRHDMVMRRVSIASTRREQVLSGVWRRLVTRVPDGITR